MAKKGVNAMRELAPISWLERVGEAVGNTGEGGSSRLETLAVWAGAVLLLLILVLNTTLD